MSQTPRFGVPFMSTNMVSKEAVFNEAAIIFDALTQASPISRTTQAPTTGQELGDLYIVPIGATGAWAGRDNEFAIWANGWNFIAPPDGSFVWVRDETAVIRYSTTAGIWLLGFNVDNDLPVLTAGDAGKFLQVNLTEDGYDLVNNTLPPVSTGDAGRVLTVNLAEDGYELLDPAAQLPAIIAGDAGKVLTVNGTEDGYILSPSAGGGGATDFLALTDTPGAYTGEAGKFLVVNPGATGVEFVDGGSGDVEEAPINGASHVRINAKWLDIADISSGADVGDGLGLTYIPSISTGTWSTSAFASKGSYFRVNTDRILTEFSAPVGGGQDVRLFVLRMNDDFFVTPVPTVQEIVYQSGIDTFAIDGVMSRTDLNIRLNANTFYVFLVQRTDAGPTGVCRVSFNSNTPDPDGHFTISTINEGWRDADVFYSPGDQGAEGNPLGIAMTLRTEGVFTGSLGLALTALEDTPSSLGTAGQVLAVNGAATALEFIDRVVDFLNLGDTPASYFAEEGSYLAVNGTGDGIEFVAPPSGGGSSTFLGLSDTPGTFSGQGNKVPIVNEFEDGLFFGNLSFTSLSQTPNSIGAAGQFLAVDGSGFALEFVAAPSGGGGASAFTGLSDTPASFSGHGGKVPIVNEFEDALFFGNLSFTNLTQTPSSLGTSGQLLAVDGSGFGLEFIDAPSGGGASTFVALTDTPGAMGSAGQFLSVNGAGTALEFVAAPSGGGTPTPNAGIENLAIVDLTTLGTSAAPTPTAWFDISDFDEIDIAFMNCVPSLGNATIAIEFSTDGSTPLSLVGDLHSINDSGSGPTKAIQAYNATRLTLGSSSDVSGILSGRAAFHGLQGTSLFSFDQYYGRSNFYSNRFFVSNPALPQITHCRFVTTSNDPWGSGTLSLNARASTNLVVPATSYDLRAAFTDPPAVSGIIERVLVPTSRTLELPANLVGSVGLVGTNPTASFVMDLLDDGVVIATITISTGGVFTFATTGGTAKTVAGGSLLLLRGPASVDATIADMDLTILGGAS